MVTPELVWFRSRAGLSPWQLGRTEFHRYVGAENPTAPPATSTSPTGRIVSPGAGSGGFATPASALAVAVALTGAAVATGGILLRVIRLQPRGWGDS
jgi:hypothetical protein